MSTLDSSATFTGSGAGVTRNGQVRVGVVGLRRGRMFAQIAAAHPDARLTALCDQRADRLDHVADAFQDLDPVRCRSFEQLLDADIDAVVLANDATGHVPLAIAALDAGKHVLSEVPACATMGEAVRLVEAAERSAGVFMMAENYCFRPAVAEIRRRYAAGDLGEFQHGEGEYVHDTEEIWPQLTHGLPKHWRNWRSSTFYCTHSIGPLLHITGTRVTRLVAMETPNRIGHSYGRMHGDSAVIICQTSNNGTIKSLQSHGGLKREPASTWLLIGGTKGSAETDRWDNSRLWSYVPEPDGHSGAAIESTPDLNDVCDLSRCGALVDRFRTAHGGSDLVTSHLFLQAVLGRCETPIDAYRATDMSIPGLLAFRSIIDGNVPYDVPDLRDPAARDRWRDDEWSVGASGAPAMPTSFPVADVPDELYRHQQELADAAGYPPIERM